MSKVSVFIILGIAICLTTLSVLAEVDTVANSGLIAKGAKVYNDNCGRCHHPRLAEEFTIREWAAVMPHMREKAHMTGVETRAVEAFMAVTLTAEKASPGQSLGVASDDSSGEALFSRYGCVGCHAVKKEAGKIGPSLHGVVARIGSEMVLHKLRDPAFNNPGSLMPKFPFSDDELDRLVLYLQTL